MDNIPTEPGQSYANVKWQLPVHTDNSNESLTLHGLRPPQKLVVGKKHITYKATDSSGLSRSCIFLIHVKGTHCIHLKGISYVCLVVYQITSSIWSYSRRITSDNEFGFSACLLSISCDYIMGSFSFSEVEWSLCHERETRRNSEFQTKFKPMFDLLHLVKLLTTKSIYPVQITP